MYFKCQCTLLNNDQKLKSNQHDSFHATVSCVRGLCFLKPPVILLCSLCGELTNSKKRCAAFKLPPYCPFFMLPVWTYNKDSTSKDTPTVKPVSTWHRCFPTGHFHKPVAHFSSFWRPTFPVCVFLLWFHFSAEAARTSRQFFEAAYSNFDTDQTSWHRPLGEWFLPFFSPPWRDTQSFEKKKKKLKKICLVQIYDQVFLFLYWLPAGQSHCRTLVRCCLVFDFCPLLSF